eukprot:760308-Hanusia_phi.AAC.3
MRWWVVCYFAIRYSQLCSKAFADVKNRQTDRWNTTTHITCLLQSDLVGNSRTAALHDGVPGSTLRHVTVITRKLTVVLQQANINTASLLFQVRNNHHKDLSCCSLLHFPRKLSAEDLADLGVEDKDGEVSPLLPPGAVNLITLDADDPRRDRQTEISVLGQTDRARKPCVELLSRSQVWRPGEEHQDPGSQENRSRDRPAGQMTSARRCLTSARRPFLLHGGNSVRRHCR